MSNIHTHPHPDTCSESNANARQSIGIHSNSYSNSLIPVPFKLPRINPKYLTKPYPYIYGVRTQPGHLFDVLIRLDVQSKEEVDL
ncbi:unnamed protein product [Rotaria sp. Silwood2]|nr:unnamed protein product [Rotaria sp. Silwood2]CAF4085261.1 unnamed protein product [Rotaria sp. Silwood2]CAF4102609.1 unnamed protein product [Rotaria sp. Silwood2]